MFKIIIPISFILQEIPIVVVANKIDLIEIVDREQVMEWMKNELPVKR